MDGYYELATSYFDALGEAFPPIGTFFSTAQPQKITARHRGLHGGHVLFRSVGLQIFTRTVIDYRRATKEPPEACVQELSVVPVNLTEAPYANVIWDPARHKIIIAGKQLALHLLQYMIGLDVNRDELVEKYSRALGREGTKVRLPHRVLEFG